MKYSTKSALAVASAIAVLVSGCGGGGQTTTELRDTLVVAQGSDAKTLDPHMTNDQPSSRVAAQVYSQLVTTDENMNIVPDLAESWAKVDDNTTQFKLREGVKFHNGEEFTAADVKFTLERMIDSPTVAHIAGTIKSVDVVDDHTVNIITKQPFGPLLHHLTHTASSILNEEAVTAAGDNYGQHPIGTGPYKFVSWTAGDTISLSVNNDYYGGAQQIPNVKFRNIIEGSNRTIALETGEADIAYDIEPIDRDTVKGNEDLKLLEGDSLNTSFFGFNTRKEPFNDVRVRQAIGYAINDQDIIDAVTLGAAKPTNSSINTKVFGYNPDAYKYEQDLEKARKLMAEAGYEKGFKTSVWTNDNPARVQIAQILQAQLRQIGIDMAIEVMEWGAFLDGISRGGHDTYLFGWITVTGDADYGLFPLYHTSQFGGAGNRTFYSVPEVDKMLEDARASSDSEERKRLYAEVQQKLQIDLPHYPLYVATQNAGMRKDVEGFKLAPAGHHKVKGTSFAVN